MAVLGTSASVPDMEGTLGSHTNEPTRVAAVVDFFGPTDFLQMNRKAARGGQLDHDSARSPESLLLGGPVQENPEFAATASPITYVTDDDPPFLIVHGTDDRLVPFNQSELLHAALEEADVESTLITVEGGGHGQGFPREVNQTVRRFFDHHLRDQSSEWKDTTVESTGGRRP